MFHDPELVKKVIVAQKLSRLIAYEINSQDRIDQCEGAPNELCKALDALMGYVPGAFRVECGTENDVVATGGKVGTGSRRSPFVWKLMGTAGQSPAQPAANGTTVIHASAPTPSGYISPGEHSARVEVETLKAEVRRITMCMHDVPYAQPCRACDAEEDDDEEEEEEQGEAKGIDVNTAKEMVSLFRDVFRDLKGTGRIERKEGTVTGPVSAEMTDDDRATWVAIQRMKQGNEAEFESYRKWLMENYGTDQPASNGAGK